MSGPVAAGVALMGALGALSRWGVGLLLARWVPSGFPVGTLVVNLLGCFVLGVVTGVSADALPAHIRTPLATGFLGSFTTFSTFSVESVKLAEQGQWGLFAVNVLGSVGLGLLGALGGLLLGRSLG